jgi:hypothetical protein
MYIVNPLVTRGVTRGLTPKKAFQGGQVGTGGVVGNPIGGEAVVDKCLLVSKFEVAGLKGVREHNLPFVDTRGLFLAKIALGKRMDGDTSSSR